MAKKDYAGLAAKILELVGGAENVSFCEHCITRLRFNVKDKSLVRDDELNELEDTNGRLWVGEQLQVIIGTAVNSVYDEVCKQGHFTATATIDENLDKPKEKKTIKTVLKGMINTLVECIIPVLPAIVGMGLFAAVSSVIGQVGFNWVSADSGLYKMLSFAQNGIMFFLPVGVAYTAAKKFNCSPLFAIMLASIQLFPDWMAAVTDGSLSPLGFAPSPITLNTQIIPVIVEIWMMTKIEKVLNKVIPDNFKFIFVGFLELLIMLPISLYLITPLGTQVGFMLAYPVTLLESVSPVLVSMIAGFVYNLFICVGMHSALSGVFVMDFFTKGVNFSLLPTVFSQCWITAGTDLGLMARTKNKKLKQSAKECAVSSVVGGVVEPSIYGIWMKKWKILLASCIGMASTAIAHRLLGVGAYAMSASNFLGFTAFLAGGLDNLLKSLVGTVVGTVVAFVVAYALGKDTEEAK